MALGSPPRFILCGGDEWTARTKWSRWSMDACTAMLRAEGALKEASRTWMQCYADVRGEECLTSVRRAGTEVGYSRPHRASESPGLVLVTADVEARAEPRRVSRGRLTVWDVHVV